MGEAEISIINGDCLVEMAKMEPNSVDTIVTDPPYGLEFMGKEWDRLIDKRPTHNENKASYKGNGRHGGGSDPHVQSRVTYQAGAQAQDWHSRWAVEALRVAKPGAILMAFGGTRTFHRLACAIEDAGWEIRDTVMWVYGSGFPKSHDISKGIDKANGKTREVIGIEDSRNRFDGGNRQSTISSAGTGYGSIKDGLHDITAPTTDSAKLWNGWGTALKPAWEPILICMKPLDGTFAENAQKWGVAGLWIDGGRVGTERFASHGGGIFIPGPDSKEGQVPLGRLKPLQPREKEWQGRWPANLLHDGSDEVLAGFPNTNTHGGGIQHYGGVFGGNDHQHGNPHDGPSSGSAARFFYVAKASRAEREMGCEGMEEYTNLDLTGGDRNRENERAGTNRNGPLKARNHHPTVKPLALMRYLVRLTKTPTGGIVLDPFMGSGTTGMACKLEGREFIGIEIDKEYFEIAEKRIAAAVAEQKEEDKQLDFLRGLAYQ